MPHVAKNSLINLPSCSDTNSSKVQKDKKKRETAKEVSLFYVLFLFINHIVGSAGDLQRLGMLLDKRVDMSHALVL